DVCAVLPSPDEVKSFLADTDQNKRAKLIDRLLDRPEYADFWTLKWMDVLRNSRRNLGVKGAEAYQKWLNEHFKKNTPFDQGVRASRRGSAHGRRQHIREGPGQLLPRRSCPGGACRIDGAAFPGRAHAMQQVPQSSVREMDAGRLLQHRRLLRAGQEQDDVGR